MARIVNVLQLSTQARLVTEDDARRYENLQWSRELALNFLASIGRDPDERCARLPNAPDKGYPRRPGKR